MTLRQMFTSYYQNALGLQEIEACQCEMKTFPNQRCSNTAYWRYNGIAICPGHIQLVANKQGKEAVSVNITART